MASIDVIQVNVIEYENDEWMMGLIGFLINRAAPEDENKARNVKLRALRFEMKNCKLYKRMKRSYGGPIPQCVNGQEAQEIMTEIHEGTFLAYQGSDTLQQ